MTVHLQQQINVIYNRGIGVDQNLIAINYIEKIKY
jgi:hypothetical protein